MEPEIASRAAAGRIQAEAGRCPVTIGLIDGSTHVGTLGPFSPMHTDVPLQSLQGSRQLLPAERVAYVAYHKSAERAAPASAGTDRYKIHVGGRKEFRVLARLAAEEK